MAIERKTLPYEILIRFNSGGSHQPGKLGDFCGAHFIEAAAVIDSDSGEVLSYKQGDARVLPEDMIAKYLTEQFGKVDAGFRAMEAERDDAVRQMKEVIEAAKVLASDSASKVATLEGRIKELERVRADVAAMVQRAAPQPS